jgi:diguanylate cyclase (GGDEF)-like protein/PAS domain S-box-containing protein
VDSRRRGGVSRHATGSEAATERVRLQRLLTLAHELNRIWLSEPVPEAAVVAATRAVCASQEWDAGTYWRLDEADGVLRVHAGWSVDDARIQAVLRQALTLACGPGVGLVGEVLRTGDILWVPDLRRDPRVVRTGLAGATGWAAALLVPVSVDGRLIGVLDFNAPSIPEPDTWLLDTLQGLAMQLGQCFNRSEALARLRDREERYADMVELAAIGISHIDPSGRFVHVNQALCALLGYTATELLGRKVKEVSYPDDVTATDADVARLNAGAIDSFTAEKRYVRKDGAVVWVRLTVAAKRDADGHVLHHVSIVEDVTDRRQAEARIEHLAAHDELTGLYNRSMFHQLLARALAQGRRYRRGFAVLFIDLDRFKAINDSFGHQAGDALLKATTARLQGLVRASDVLARFGGDEFVALIETPTREAAGIAAAKMVDALMAPTTVLGHECRVTASIGIATFPEDADDGETLIKHADMAMYLAKDDGKNAYRFYAADVGTMAVERMELEGHLRHALERHELSLQYQAKVHLQTGDIRGVEALLRWDNPVLGSVSPTRFIPLAEETGLIVSLGRWVLQTACAQAATWIRDGLSPVCMAVNVSPVQFRDPELVPTIRRALADTGLPPALLELEITESMVMQDVDRVSRKLREIQALGVRLAIDDFGTGYSSLAQLKRFPINTLKIDRSFIRDVSHNSQDRAITEAIIAVGRSLGVTVVAEGVETASQQEYLRGQACDEMQGFYFSKPCTPEAFVALLREQRRAAS